MCMTKMVLRTGVIAAAVGGAAVLLAGPDRIAAIFQQARSGVHSAIDSQIEDPVALRAQLRKLEGQYPRRIAEVRADLGELNQQVDQLQRELQVSRRVVALAEGDLQRVQAVLARAEEARGTAAGGAGVAVVRVRFDDTSMSLDEGYARANHISQVRGVYATRTADIETSLQHLTLQRDRLGKLLGQLETERAQFQTQLWQLDREVDSIARNERMIDLMKKREAAIDEHSRYRVESLDQYKARFAQIRARQEAQIQSMSTTSKAGDYESAAKIQLDAEAGAKAAAVRPSIAAPAIRTLEIAPEVIEIGPEDLDGSTPTPEPKSTPTDRSGIVASRGG